MKSLKVFHFYFIFELFEHYEKLYISVLDRHFYNYNEIRHHVKLYRHISWHWCELYASLLMLPLSKSTNPSLFWDALYSLTLFRARVLVLSAQASANRLWLNLPKSLYLSLPKYGWRLFMPNFNVLARKMFELWTISQAWVERPLLYFPVDFYQSSQNGQIWHFIIDFLKPVYRKRK